MCGIAGFVDPVAARADQTATHLAAMLASIAHRGPDDWGAWHEGTVSLGHRRLSIVDLSPLGHQPMVSANGRYVLTLNGEIYNYRTLRRRLEAQGHVFRGHSDTEVLLALIERVGLFDALRRCIGMFAIALWDREQRLLQLARDRFGEKPMFYGWHRGALLFGSELKALAAHPSFVRDIDPESVGSLIRYGYVPAPHSIFRSTFKLQPGTILGVKVAEDGAPGRSAECELHPYWSHEDALMDGLSNRVDVPFEEATRGLETLLRDAVGMQMHADVPLGAMLSGGIDSSLVVALMQQQSSRPVRTYSIGFELAAFDEAKQALAVAGHLRTDHTELYVSSADALAMIPTLPRMYDEPLGDSSQIPTALVARLARTDVTVALSGDGGDEIFCGYVKYAFGERFAGIRSRRILGALLAALPWAGLERSMSLFPPPVRRKITAKRLRALYDLLSAPKPQHIAEMISAVHRDQSTPLLKDELHRPTAFTKQRPAALESGFQPLAMLIDRETYLPDDVLTKVDRATMAVGLESRAPLLDHRVAEYAARLPMSYLVQGSVSKRILREVLYRHVPRALVDRPKTGFSAPVAHWLRHGLKSWACDLLHGSRDNALLDVRQCQALFERHCQGEGDHSGVLWTVLGFLAWSEAWL